LKTPARRALAWLVCRGYALLPCLVTPLVAGVLCLCAHGAIGALALVGVSFGVMAAAFPDFLERPTSVLANAALYAALLALPAVVVPWRGLLGFGAGFALEAAADVVLLALLPRLPFRAARALQPELFADVLTALLLIGLLGLPAWAAARAGAARRWGSGPFDISVLLCAFEEDATIERSLDSIRAAARRAAGLPLVRTLRVVLVDSSPSPACRDRLRPRVERVIEGGPGKLSSRHRATLLEASEIVVAADADRCYDEDWLERLLSPFDEARVVATMGETRNWGGTLSGSALSRTGLKLPFNGGNSAYRREAYLAAPFDEHVDEFSHRRLWLEEEFLFGLTLRAQGRVVHVADCRSYELRPYPLWRQLSRHLFGTRLKTF
jgi:hypothetical protein